MLYKNSSSFLGELFLIDAKKEIVWLILAVVTCVLLLTSTLFSPMCKAADGWSDDFNDGNYNGWTVYGFDSGDFPLPILEGNFSIADGSLRAQGPHWGYASHPSTVEYSYWSFEVDAVDTTDHHTIIFFYSTGPDNNGTHFFGMVDFFAIIIVTDVWHSWTGHGFGLLKTVNSVTTRLDFYYPSGEITGWQNVEVTRSELGQINVYINGTLRMSATDTTITAPTHLMLHAQSGVVLDNVIVTESGEPTTPTTTPTPGIPGFPLEAIILGIGIGLGSLIVYRKRWKR